jgi:hypothetical protein
MAVKRRFRSLRERAAFVSAKVAKTIAPLGVTQRREFRPDGRPSMA